MSTDQGYSERYQNPETSEVTATRLAWEAAIVANNEAYTRLSATRDAYLAAMGRADKELAKQGVLTDEERNILSTLTDGPYQFPPQMALDRALTHLMFLGLVAYNPATGESLLTEAGKLRAEPKPLSER